MRALADGGPSRPHVVTEPDPAIEHDRDIIRPLMVAGVVFGVAVLAARRTGR
jgi:hypothetical protein